MLQKRLLCSKLPSSHYFPFPCYLEVQEQFPQQKDLQIIGISVLNFTTSLTITQPQVGFTSNSSLTPCDKGPVTLVLSMWPLLLSLKHLRVRMPSHLTFKFHLCLQIYSKICIFNMFFTYKSNPPHRMPPLFLPANTIRQNVKLCIGRMWSPAIFFFFYDCFKILGGYVTRKNKISNLNTCNCFFCDQVAVLIIYFCYSSDWGYCIYG